jgi:anti-sigma28 factor (negative regulator of flagellin synthesis)
MHIDNIGISKSFAVNNYKIDKKETSDIKNKDNVNNLDNVISDERTEKIEKIKNVIISGQYKIYPDKIAEKMIK